MRESAFWQTVRPLLLGLDPHRVENAVELGTPDVNITLGWIELKSLGPEDVPKRPETVVRIPHFTAQQRVWHLKRGMSHGKTWLLVRFDKEWLLFDGMEAATHLGKTWNTATMRAKALSSWATAPSKADFQQALRHSVYPF